MKFLLFAVFLSLAVFASCAPDGVYYESSPAPEPPKLNCLKCTGDENSECRNATDTTKSKPDQAKCLFGYYKLIPSNDTEKTVIKVFREGALDPVGNPFADKEKENVTIARFENACFTNLCNNNTIVISGASFSTNPGMWVLVSSVLAALAIRT